MANFLFDIEQLLPFFFVLAVVFGALEVSGVFKNRGVNGLISVVVALFAIINPSVSAIIYAIMPYAIIIFIIFFFLGFIIKFFSSDEKGKPKDLTLPVIIAGLILIFLASYGENLSSMFPSMGFFSSDNFIVVVILVVVMIALFATYKAKSS